MTASNGPNRLAWSAMPRVSAMLARSPTTTPCAFGAAVCASRARPALRAWTTTSWPAASNRCAAIRPRPSDDPVIRTLLIDRPHDSQNRYVAPRGIDEYLAALDEPKRTTLQKLRHIIRGIIPDAEECIAYLPHSGSLFGELSDDLAGYESTPGSLHFPIDKPLPPALVKKLIVTRLKEVRSRALDKGRSA